MAAGCDVESDANCITPSPMGQPLTVSSFEFSGKVWLCKVRRPIRSTKLSMMYSPTG